MAVTATVSGSQVGMMSGVMGQPSHRLGSRRGLLLGAVLASLFGSSAGLWIASPSVTVGAPLIAAVVAGEVRRNRRRVERREAAAVMPQLADQLVQQLRAGRSLAQSCAQLDRLATGQCADRLSPMPELLRSGRTLEESAGALTASPDHMVRLFGVTLMVLAGNGGPAVPALQRLRHTLMAVVHGQQRADAESSQAMASAGLLVLAPGLFAVMVAVVDPGVADLYLFESLGAICIMTALALSWVGWSWMHHLLRSAERRVT